jgi:hypothetical protein
MIGSRAEVFHGTADSTSGGLTKKDLTMKDGRIISKAASKAAKKSLKKNPKFQVFIDEAKKKSDKKGCFCAMPSNDTKAYEKLMKKAEKNMSKK